MRFVRVVKLRLKRQRGVRLALPPFFFGDEMENDEFYYECPDDCNGCTCLNTAPCSHCVDHCKEKLYGEEKDIMQAFIDFIKQELDIDFGITVHEFANNKYHYRVCWQDKENFFRSGYKNGGKNAKDFI